MDQAFQQRLQAVGLDPDTIRCIVKVGNRADLPSTLANQWAVFWSNQTKLSWLALASQSPEDRLRTIARRADDFLQSPTNRVARVTFAATQAADPDLRAAGELAVELQDLLVAFGRDIVVPATSPFTGKVKYATLTDLDVVTTKAIIEVTTSYDASGKVAQLNVLRGAIANPLALPVFHYMPNVHPLSAPARSLQAAGSHGVYTDRGAIVTAVRALP